MPMSNPPHPILPPPSHPASDRRNVTLFSPLLLWSDRYRALPQSQPALYHHTAMRHDRCHAQREQRTPERHASGAAPAFPLSTATALPQCLRPTPASARPPAAQRHLRARCGTFHRKERLQYSQHLTRRCHYPCGYKKIPEERMIGENTGDYLADCWDWWKFWSGTYQQECHLGIIRQLGRVIDYHGRFEPIGAKGTALPGLHSF